jgi:heme/copper-type cytochrome/quinol oxidase subunit 2
MTILFCYVRIEANTSSIDNGTSKSAGKPRGTKCNRSIAVIVPVVVVVVVVLVVVAVVVTVCLCRRRTENG